MWGFASFFCLTGSKWTAFGFWSVCWTKEDILRCHFGRFYIFIGVKIISGWIYNENKPSFSRSSCCLIGPTINNRCKIPLSVSQNRRAESSCESGSFTPTFSMITRVKILCRGGRRERLLRGSAAASTDQTAALPQDIVFEQRAGAAIIHAFTPTAEWSHFQAAGVPMYAYLWVKSTSSRPLSGGCWKAFWEKLGISDWSGSRRESGYTELMAEALHITDGWYNSVRVSEGGCSFKMSAEYPALWGLFSGGVHLTGSVVDDLKLTPLCSMMGDFGSPRCAHSPDVVEEVDRLQLLHPSWLFYESAVINMIGGVQAFSVPRRNELETGDVRRQTALTAPPDVGESQVLTSSSGTWVQMAVGILGSQQPSGTNYIVFVLICTVTRLPGTPPLSLMLDRNVSGCRCDPTPDSLSENTLCFTKWRDAKWIEMCAIC